MALYTTKDIITGLMIYGVGDAIAALLAGAFSIERCIGMACVGAFIYGLEIPHYFRWVAHRTANIQGRMALVARTLYAMLYFNPLWVARHLAFIALLSGQSLEGLLWVALQSFASALPITVSANFIIQNKVPLKYRFAASACFSCCMAIFYPLVASLF